MPGPLLLAPSEHLRVPSRAERPSRLRWSPGTSAELQRQRRQTAAVLISVCLYAGLLAGLAQLMCAQRSALETIWILDLQTATETTPPPEFEVELTAVPELEPQHEVFIPAVVPLPVDRPARIAVQSPPRNRTVSPDEGRPLPHAKVGVAAPQFLLTRVDAPIGGGFQGRTPGARGRLLEQRGGTQAGEDAVERALRWLSLHQSGDGAWRFSHAKSNCRGCENRGNHPSTTGATALALLPFLGAGYTHREGHYQDTVRTSLMYLRHRAHYTARGADFQEGSMYAQGITAVALCEAFAMTGDEELRKPAQGAVDFIANVQHEEGGWRYYPGQAGDTTVFGWQIMALRSASLAGLEIPPGVLEKAIGYLDSVEASDGTGYGYLIRGVDRSPTAIGFLSRMYFGVNRRDDNLRRGIARLHAWGPSTHDMYYNYYATQVMHHYGGNAWADWNGQLREHLIASQARGSQMSMQEACQTGSWFFPDNHAFAGGRLYTTALCTMILEVYYRHLPLYGEESVEGD